MIIKKYLATLRFYLRLNLSRKFREQIQEIIEDLSPKDPPAGQYHHTNRLLVMVIGPLFSGKSAYIQNSPLKDYFIVDKEIIRKALNRIPSLDPCLDRSHKARSPRDWKRRAAIRYVSQILFQEGFQLGIATVSDFRNLQGLKWQKVSRQLERQKVSELARKFRYEIRIIFFFVPPLKWIQEIELLRDEADSLAIYDSETGELKELQNPA